MIDVALAFSNQSIVKGQTEVSASYNLAHRDGYFSIQPKVNSGVGTVVVWYEASLDGEVWVIPTGETAIGTFSNISGPLGNGSDVIEFSPVMTKYIRLKAICTNGNVNFSMQLAMQ